MHYTIVGPHERAVVAAHETHNTAQNAPHTRKETVYTATSRTVREQDFWRRKQPFWNDGECATGRDRTFFLIYDHIFLGCSTSITQIWTCWPIKMGPLHVHHSYDGWFAIAIRHNCVEMKYVRHGKMTIMNQNYCLFEKLCESAYPICMTHLMPLFQSIAHSKTQTN